MSSNFSQTQVVALRDALKTQADTSGLYRSVLMHEPKSAPGLGLTYCMWISAITPIPGLGGLNATAGRVTWRARIHYPWIAQDEDDTETRLMHAVLEQLAAYSGHITLGSTVYAIDLEGMYGVSLEADPIGYIQIDTVHYRVAELTIPVIIDNLWTQVD